jgi:capsid protein
MLRSISAGGGITYEALTADLSQTNYSSARLGQSMFQRRIKALQSSLLVSQLLLPIWRRWVLLEILTGRISAPDFEANPLNYLGAKFLWPGWPAIDPLKQSKADALDLNSRTRSRAEIVADHGRDLSDVNTEIENDPLFVSDPANAAALLAQPEEVQNAQ